MYTILESKHCQSLNYYKMQKSVANQVVRKQKQSYWEVAYPVKNSNIKETKFDD